MVMSRYGHHYSLFASQKRLNKATQSAEVSQKKAVLLF
jgi:hypothetical protein